MKQRKGAVVLATLAATVASCRDEPIYGCAELEPCGGDLVGTWRVRAVCPDYVGLDNDYSQCHSVEVEPVVTHDITLTFREDGTYSVEGTRSKYSVGLTRKACLPMLQSCAALSIPDYTCDEHGDVCRCEFDSTEEYVSDGTFATTGNELRADIGDKYLPNYPYSFHLGYGPRPYCVQLDHLWIRAYWGQVLSTRTIGPASESADAR